MRIARAALVPRLNSIVENHHKCARVYSHATCCCCRCCRTDAAGMLPRLMRGCITGAYRVRARRWGGVKRLRLSVVGEPSMTVSPMVARPDWTDMSPVVAVDSPAV